MRQPDSRLIPDQRQIKGEVGEDGMGGNRGGLGEDFRGMIGTVAMDLLVFGIDEPAQLCAVGDVFCQFGLEGGQGIAGGFEFDDEIGADGGKGAPLFGGEGIPTVLGNPGGIGGTNRTVGEGEASGGVEGNT